MEPRVGSLSDKQYQYNSITTSVKITIIEKRRERTEETFLCCGTPLAFT